MSKWPKYPNVLEINTWAWLSGLSRKYGKALTLDSVPSGEWDAIAGPGFDAVWLMGVWERSPAGIAIANRNPGLGSDFRRALPDFQLSDNVGSPYCVRRYSADPHLGGPNGLAVARNELADRGLWLVLDYVPNHLAPDHAWVSDHPEYFIQGTEDDARKDPASYLRIDDRVFACGRDPYFPAWPDVLQLNAFDPGHRQAARKTIAEIAGQCDGIRCDMAMLLLNSIVERTWGSRAGPPPATEYWADVIPAIRSKNQSFLFIAEAYWGLEWELQRQGFDFCYDKRLYDRLEHGDADGVRLHLSADLRYQDRLIRFIENHDERRAAAVFSPAKHRAAAVIAATLPGARLFHEGQLEGRRVRLPVYLGRRPDEQPDEGLRAFYTKLLRTIGGAAFHDGEWQLCESVGWPDNSSYRNLVAWSWVKDYEHYLIVVNLSDSTVQARVHLPWEEVEADTWRLTDQISGVSYDRAGSDIRESGLYVELAPWHFHLMQCYRLTRANA